MTSAAKTLSLIAGFLLIVSGLLGGSLVIGLILGLGAIVLSGRLKRRLWAAGFLLIGLLAISVMQGIVGEGGGVLLIIAGGVGLASSFV